MYIDKNKKKIYVNVFFMLYILCKNIIGVFSDNYFSLLPEEEVIIEFDPFDKNSKQLTLYLDSGLENNLGELVIPATLLNGDLTFYLNEQEFFPKIFGQHVYKLLGEHLINLVTY